jgi:hypothetical protein
MPLKHLLSCPTINKPQSTFNTSFQDEIKPPFYTLTREPYINVFAHSKVRIAVIRKVLGSNMDTGCPDLAFSKMFSPYSWKVS